MGNIPINPAVFKILIEYKCDVCGGLNKEKHVIVYKNDITLCENCINEKGENWINDYLNSYKRLLNENNKN